ncbi:MAG: Zn-ribbon domain-containing OB-fold protein [Nitrososphaerota archaeon]
MTKATPSRFTPNYIQQLPEDLAKYMQRHGLDKEFGRLDSWASSISKKYTGIDGWDIDNLILSYWRIACTYKHSPGAAFSRFLEGLKNGKILGTRCEGCGRVLIPPRTFCEWCFKDIDTWIEHPGTGIISTYSLSYIGTDPRVRFEKPVVVAVIWFDGTLKTWNSSKTVIHAAGILHQVGGVDPEKVQVGLRVKPVWRRPEERAGSILDIEYFAPLEDDG